MTSLNTIFLYKLTLYTHGGQKPTAQVIISASVVLIGMVGVGTTCVTVSLIVMRRKKSRKKSFNENNSSTQAANPGKIILHSGKKSCYYYFFLFLNDQVYDEPVFLEPLYDEVEQQQVQQTLSCTAEIETTRNVGGIIIITSSKY